MKKNIVLIMLSLFLIVILSSQKAYAATYEENSCDEYLLNIGFPEDEVEELDKNTKEFMVNYLKNQKEDFSFESVEKKNVTFKSNELDLNSNTKPNSRHFYRAIENDELELGVYYLSAGNNLPMNVIYPYFKWKKSLLTPHIIRNDSFSYCINANDWDIIPGSFSFNINYLVDGHRSYAKTYYRPNELTWTGATYKIPSNDPLYGDYGMAAFSIRKKNENADSRIVLHYIDDTSTFNNLSYTINVSDILTVSVSSKKNSYRDTSDMFNMFKHKK